MTQAQVNGRGDDAGVEVEEKPHDDPALSKRAGRVPPLRRDW